MKKNRFILSISVIANLVLVASLVIIIMHTSDNNQVTEQPAQPIISSAEKPKKIQVEPLQTKSDTIQIITEQVNINEPKSEPVSIPKTAKDPLPEDNLEQLRFLNSCYTGIDCGYQDHDPRQVDYQIGQEISDELRNLLSQWKNSEITETELEQAALDSLNNPDGHVQQAALDLLAQLPPSAKHFDAIIEITTENYDAMIVEQIMDELYRYIPQGYSAQIDQTFTDLITTGSPNAAQTVTQNIVPFLNNENIASYKDTLATLPANSKKAKQLKAAIEEFELQQSGG